jgi:hypothetical protein
MMNKYMAELDGINNSDTAYYETNNYGELIRWIENDLRMLGGGHADIYDEDGDFVEDVEV